MYAVHQPWDALRTCIVGRSYSPEFYQFVKNTKARQVLERIAAETEEDYQRLIALLKSFGVEIVRPELTDNYCDYLYNGSILPPPMVPRDYGAMIGNQFHFNYVNTSTPQLPQVWQPVLNQIAKANAVKLETGVFSASVSTVGKDLYFGTSDYSDNQHLLRLDAECLFPDYRCHVVNTGGHSDATFCPVVPGLIVSLYDVPTYQDTFPGWEVVYLPGQSWGMLPEFQQLKKRNRGRWWVPGEELNSEFVDYVEQWLSHWVGYVEETVFDVNMLTIDEKNVVCNNYNPQVFNAFEQRGITPHIINFRHRYFWDGGLHCITLDINRSGPQNNYFPERD